MRTLVLVATVMLVACSSDEASTAVVPCVPPDVPQCKYWGYGSECDVRCSTPATCTFDLTVNWTGSCCSDLQKYTRCRCVDGFVQCWEPVGRERPPTSYCEFCERDTGPFDTSTDDALEETDAGPG